MHRPPLLAARHHAASGCATVNVTEQGMLHAQSAVSPRSAVASVVAAALPGVTYEEQTVIAADGTALFGALLRRPGADLTVVYFGGNEYTVERFGTGQARALLPSGANVLLVDHRGYGWSAGEPTVELLLSDALDVFDHAAGLPGVGAVVVHGQSLGSFLAAHVGANRPAAGVVLESSATTPQEWAEARVPRHYRPFVRVHVDGPLGAVDNRAAVGRITEPLLLLVGAEDATTPAVLSRRLLEASPLPDGEKMLVVVEGAGHNDVTGQPAFADAYRAFLDRVRGAR
ncbi:MAG TPA: alpha/beta fold hydrolase [Rubricoccaceae bacterium]